MRAGYRFLGWGPKYKGENGWVPMFSWNLAFFTFNTSPPHTHNQTLGTLFMQRFDQRPEGTPKCVGLRKFWNVFLQKIRPS